MTDNHADGCNISKLTLHQPITYQIKIAGRPGDNWSNWINNKMDIQVESHPSGYTTTTLTGVVDQTALIGLLRQMYHLGFPLISAKCIQSSRNDEY